MYLPDDVLVLALASYHQGEDYPRTEFAAFPEGYDPGSSKPRRPTDRGPIQWFLGDLIVRKFFPMSGPGVIVKDNAIAYADEGFQHLAGSAVSMWQNVPENGDAMLVVWRSLKRDLNEDELIRFIKYCKGLRLLMT